MLAGATCMAPPYNGCSMFQRNAIWVGSAQQHNQQQRIIARRLVSSVPPTTKRSPMPLVPKADHHRASPISTVAAISTAHVALAHCMEENSTSSTVSCGFPKASGRIVVRG